MNVLLPLPVMPTKAMMMSEGLGWVWSVIILNQVLLLTSSKMNVHQAGLQNGLCSPFRVSAMGCTHPNGNAAGNAVMMVKRMSFFALFANSTGIKDHARFRHPCT